MTHEFGISIVVLGKLQFKLLRRRYFTLLNVGFSLVRLKERTKTTRYGDEYVLYKQIL